MKVKISHYRLAEVTRQTLSNCFWEQPTSTLGVEESASNDDDVLEKDQIKLSELEIFSKQLRMGRENVNN